MKVKVSSLKHHPKNKEIYDLSSIDELMKSISEVGLLQPLTIDTFNQVISGWLTDELEHLANHS